MNAERRVSAATWAGIVVLSGALGAVALGFAGYSLGIRHLQNRTEGTAIMHAVRLRDTGAVPRDAGLLRGYVHTVETLPAGAVLTGDRGGVRVAVRSRRTIPLIGRPYDVELSTTAVLMPRTRRPGSHVVVVR